MPDYSNIELKLEDKQSEKHVFRILRTLRCLVY